MLNRPDYRHERCRAVVPWIPISSDNNQLASYLFDYRHNKNGLTCSPFLHLLILLYRFTGKPDFSISFGYGAKPSASLDFLFDITVDTTNLTHIMRAVMGLYLGMVVVWVWGSFQ